MTSVNTTKPIAMRDSLLERIWTGMSQDSDIFFTCADFGSPVLDRIRSDFPDRFVNVGIAEQNLINVSAGLALEGFKVFAYAIAPFITMRCYEQVRVSLALLSEVREMNVNLIGVGAGYSYVVSGPTHQCYEDITLMRAMPNMKVFSPADHVTSAALFGHCVSSLGPKYLRLDAQVLPVVYEEARPEVGRGFHVHRRGARVALVATGYMLHTALRVSDFFASKGVEVGVVDIFDISLREPIELARELSRYSGVVSLEEGFEGRGGLDAMLFNLLAQHAPDVSFLNVGVSGGYRFEIGGREELHEQVGIGPQAVTAKVESFLEKINS